tara:strand:+ start:652 stop:1266 length:615 start_codon:yes stop_codon:yes gene_type:complete
MAMSLKVIVPPHPLIKHWLAILRDKETPNVLYTTGYEQIGKWLTYEALRNWIPFKQEKIETDTGSAEVFVIDRDYPIRIIAQIPEGLTLWMGAKEVLPNASLSLGELPTKIEKNEGIVVYSQRILKKNNPLKTLRILESLGVKSNRIVLISCLCSEKGLNEIAKEFHEITIFTSSIDKEDIEDILIPGIGNPISKLSTMFLEKD